MFNTSIKIFKDNVFFGSGIKTFRKKCKEDKYFVIQNYSLFKDKPHNYYKGFTGGTHARHIPITIIYKA